jgi:hypothetical protein
VTFRHKKSLFLDSCLNGENGSIFAQMICGERVKERSASQPEDSKRGQSKDNLSAFCKSACGRSYFFCILLRETFSNVSTFSYHSGVNAKACCANTINNDSTMADFNYSQTLKRVFV